MSHHWPVLEPTAVTSQVRLSPVLPPEVGGWSWTQKNSESWWHQGIRISKNQCKEKKLSKNSWNWPFQGSGNPQKVYSNLKSSLLRQRGKGPRGSLGPLILTDLALTYSPAKQQSLKFQQQGADPEPRELLHTHSCLARPAPGPPEGPHLQGCLYLPDS